MASSSLKSGTGDLPSSLTSFSFSPLCDSLLLSFDDLCLDDEPDLCLEDEDLWSEYLLSEDLEDLCELDFSLPECLSLFDDLCELDLSLLEDLWELDLSLLEDLCELGLSLLEDLWELDLCDFSGEDLLDLWECEDLCEFFLGDFSGLSSTWRASMNDPFCS